MGHQLRAGVFVFNYSPPLTLRIQGRRDQRRLSWLMTSKPGTRKDLDLNSWIQRRTDRATMAPTRTSRS